MTPDSSFKDSCLKEEQNNWALAGDSPEVKGDIACCVASVIAPGGGRD